MCGQTTWRGDRRWLWVALLPATLGAQDAGGGTTELSATSAEQLTARAADLVRQGRARAALYWLEQAERRGAGGVALHYNRGVAQRLLSRHEEALAAFERAQAAAPDAPQVLYGLATALQTADRHAEAVPLLRIAVEAAPSHAEIHLGLGLALAATDRLEEALAAFARAAELDTAAAAPVYQMGELLQRQGKTAEAAQLLSRAAALDSTLVEARVGLGRARLLTGDAAGAAAALEAAVALAPRNQHAYYLLARACAELGLDRQRQQILAAFRRLSEAARHKRQGVLLERQGKLDEAVREWRRAIAADSSYAEPWILTGEALLRLGEPEDAGMAFAGAIERSPTSVRARFGFGRVHFLAGRFEESLAVFDHILKREPDHLDAHYQAGLASARLGLVEKARKHLRCALDLDPGHEGAREALASLASR